jgi:thiosulfate dehydrogenase [quinone] large subunit
MTMKRDYTPGSASMFRPAECLAALRVVVGLYFLKALWTKFGVVLLGGVLPFIQVEQRWLSVMPKIVARQAAENPFPAYKAFLDQVVLTHAPLFGQLTAWGELLVGISLVLGLLAGLGALGGLLLSLSYGFAAQHLSGASFGLHYLLVTAMVLFFIARSGRAIGLDGWIARRWPGRWFTRRPFS